MEYLDLEATIVAAVAGAVCGRTTLLPGIKITVGIKSHETTAGAEVYEVEVKSELLPDGKAVGS